MKILGFARWLAKRLKQQPSVPGGPKPYAKNAGNVFFALFAAVAMVGAVGYGFNTVLRGPISAMSETTRRTVAESTLVTASRLAIVGATTQQTGSGDTDADGMIEPIPYKDAAAAPHPVGGGYLPDELHIPSTIDPWNTQYGYCAWDHGTSTASTGRLAGSADSNRYSIAIISAGRNKKFETSCVAYVDDSTQLIQLTPGSDDIVLAYTYAEANNLGNGLWKPKNSTTAMTEKNMEVVGGGKVANKVELSGNQTTGGGLILPRDPGDDSLTGACDALVNDKQLRYNVGDGSEAPVIEICDAAGLGWTPVSGGAGDGSGGTTVVGQLVAHYKFDETDGTVAHDETGEHDGTLTNNPAWAPAQGKIGGALKFTAGDESYVRVARTAALEPSSVTVAMWVKRTGAQSTNAGLLTKTSLDNGSPTYHTYGLYANGASDDSLQWNVGHAAAKTGPVSTNFMTDGEWFYVVGVYDPAGAAPQSRFYVNGVLNASETDTVALAYDKTNTGDIYIGGTQAAAGEKFTGYIDDVRIYNYGMTDAQVKSLYDNVNASSLNLTSPKKPGTVFSWGLDSSEMLGNGTEGDRTAPGPVTGGSDFIQISGGGAYHACGVKSDGTVWCWGSDASGQLGNDSGVTADQSAPYQVTGLSNVIKVSAGDSHSCAVQKKGRVWCWGSNGSGALGTGGGNTTVPALVSISNAIDISAGASTTCAITSDGTAWCWGEGSNGQLGNGASNDSTTPVRVSDVSDFTSISVGSPATVCGTTKRGIGYCWGSDSNGQLGNDATSGDKNTPNEIDLPEDFTKISISGNTACGLRASGKISCWGEGTSGQMGNGTTTATNPAPVEVSDPGPFIDVSVGWGQTICAVKTTGSVWCWGSDSNGVLGDGDLNSSGVTRPVQTKLGNAFQISGRNVRAMYALVDTSAVAPVGTNDFNRKFTVAASETDALHACQIRADGTLWCWGVEGNGELGNGGGATDTAANPVAVTDPGPWYQVSAGRDHTCAIKTDGTAWCWGTDANGELGNAGTTGDQVSPSPVTNADNVPWTQISAGIYSTCGIKVDGSLWCWGGDSAGQLGNGAGGSSTQPSAVTSSLPWTMVSMGYGTACGIKSDNTLWCWGDASYGRLGNGTTSPALQSPAQVGSDKWSYIRTSAATVCGIKTDGSLWCWGNDGVGILGNGATLTADQTRPYPVAEPGPWRNVAVGSWATCATKIDGSGWCWGKNERMLGYGALPGADVSYPRQVVGTDWAMIDGGGASLRCGVKNDGSAWCWGNGASGTTNSNAPLKIYQPYKANFVETDASTTTSAFQPIASMAIGSTSLTDTEGTSQGLAFPGSGRSSLYQATTANQFMLETAPLGGVAQIWLNANSLPYYMGYNAYTGGLEFGYGADWLSKVTAPGLELSSNGFVGVGTGGAPVASLDIRGALRVGDAGSGCSGSNSGTIKYVDSLMQYCDGADWVPLAGTPGGGGSTDPLPWDMSLKNLSTGSSHTCGNQADGSLWCWGWTDQGQVGNGATSPNEEAPIHIGSDTWIQIDAGYAHTCGIQADGSLWCWGDDQYGQLGNGATSSDQTAPVKIGTSSWIQIAAGRGHTCGIQADGSLWCWGLDADGALGNGAPSSTQTSPVKIGTSSWIQITAHEHHTCGIQADGSLWCWGLETQGRLGNGSMSGNETSPVKIGSSSWTKISAGLEHTCGIQTSGSLWCWGRANKGQVGNGGWGTYQTPQKVGNSSWIRVSASWAHSCGIQADGSLWCWGDTGYGQLGNGATSPDQNSPVKIGTSLWTQIAAGYGHTCGVQTDGSLWCWGYNNYGQLGMGPSTPPPMRSTPQRIGP
jgi:alpha-tubulin suppressor-like RCC1 family protein